MDILKMKRQSWNYNIRILQEDDIPMIYQLCEKNTQFYKYCPPYVTYETIRQDMAALPPGKKEDDKFFLGYFKEDKLIAIMDLIWHYPDEETVYIGLFMVERSMQGKGLGTEIITALGQKMKRKGIRDIQLAYARGNSQSETFRLKNKFEKTGKETTAEEYVAVSMKKVL